MPPRLVVNRIRRTKKLNHGYTQQGGGMQGPGITGNKDSCARKEREQIIEFTRFRGRDEHSVRQTKYRLDEGPFAAR